MQRFAFTLVAVSFCASPVFAAGLVPDDVYHIASIGDPTFSPDGSKIAAVELHIDKAKDKSEPTLVLIDVATKAKRALTVAREGLA